MNRMFIIAVALFALMAGLMPAQVIAPASAMDHAQHQACIKECHTCGEVCKKAISYSKKKGGALANAKHINALEDCASACRISEDYMTRNSDLMKKTCALCEEVCRKCAESCDQFKDDAEMKACAEECRKCADSCKKMQES
ncbi:MAG: four-helix bundle copper-binding protein [Candidatus Obscuribacterales bacterium]|nr:four-helix bundle copper-binding protein [Candidatus Obscuribacterales bacterium]